MTITPVQSFDLPDRLDVDHVAICSNDDPNEPHFEAVPFQKPMDDYGHYEEIAPFTVTEEYRDIVAKKADMDITEIKLKRPPVAHGGPV
jgi:hypothetical protein